MPNARGKRGQKSARNLAVVFSVWKIEYFLFAIRRNIWKFEAIETTCTNETWICTELVLVCISLIAARFIYFLNGAEAEYIIVDTYILYVNQKCVNYRGFHLNISISTSLSHLIVRSNIVRI